jgi:hypothetical protein
MQFDQLKRREFITLLGCPGKQSPCQASSTTTSGRFVSGCCGGRSPGSTVSMLGPTIPPMLLARAGEVIKREVMTLLGSAVAVDGSYEIL